ncbi:glycosyltransferase family 87 protein [Cyanobium sp. Cruz-8D1]|uniref:glycosyltransferase family 87 protein n=2 Tax=unclassified Cyanobium TaxID=2627006 RepID=UPI0028F45CBB|nr:glycosyltransferase family 87 protein [Cyanobium sp. Cruz-8D1]
MASRDRSASCSTCSVHLAGLLCRLQPGQWPEIQPRSSDSGSDDARAGVRRFPAGFLSHEPPPAPTGTGPISQLGVSPYAQPMFGFFFVWGGSGGAWRLVHGLSLLSLGLISWIGWRTLRFAGPAAGLLGALAPVAIGGNSNCLYHGQFSILCMGLISLQWWLLERQRPLPAGISWALAMLKPQIAAAFALPLLQRGNRRGLLLGLAVLLVLSGIALAYTHVSPIRYVSLWLVPSSLSFVRAGNTNLMGLLGPWVGAILTLTLLLGGLFLARKTAKGRHQQGSMAAPRRVDPGTMLRLQGLCAVLGALAAYHLNYDNIMLFPAQLAILSLALRHPGIWIGALAVAMQVSLWIPVHLTADRFLPQTLSAAIWFSVGLTLLANRPENFRTTLTEAATECSINSTTLLERAP